MFLQTLSATNYKNLKEIEAQFCKGVNCFIGNNGMGKTNLLDAIYYLAFCKSRTCHADTQVIRHDEPYLLLDAQFSSENAQDRVSVSLQRGQKKVVKRNKKEYDRLADHIGLVPLVIVSPNDLELIIEGSSERRKLIDGIISQYDKEYLHQLLDYNRALLQRNTLLRAHATDPELLSVCEGMMAQKASYIYPKRAEFLTQFIPIFAQFYSEIAGDKEQVSIQYESHLQQGDLLPQLAQSRYKDEAIGYTTVGIHKDELAFYLGEYPLKRIASQGQTKSFLVALKLAQFEFMRRACGKFPILLLDDIFDKLDAERVERIVKLVASDKFGQIFITDTNREHLDYLLDRVEGEKKLFTIQDGAIVWNAANPKK